MLAAKVVVHEVQRHAVRVVRDLLAECIGQPSEPADRHPHGQVVALDVARRDMGGVRLALDAALPRPDAGRRAIAFLAVLRFAVDFDELGIVDIAAESALYGFQIRLVAIAGQLGPDSPAETADRP